MIEIHQKICVPAPYVPLELGWVTEFIYFDFSIIKKKKKVDGTSCKLKELILMHINFLLG